MIESLQKKTLSVSVLVVDDTISHKSQTVKLALAFCRNRKTHILIVFNAHSHLPFCFPLTLLIKSIPDMRPLVTP